MAGQLNVGSPLNLQCPLGAYESNRSIIP